MTVSSKDNARALKHTGIPDLTDEEIKEVCNYLDGKSKNLFLRNRVIEDRSVVDETSFYE